MIDEPKLLRCEDALQERRSLLNEPHMAPLTAFVEQLRTRMGPSAAIPFFDPWDGGVRATTLFLLEAPGPKARNSGFVSMNNPDETAKNFFEVFRAAGFHRSRTVSWNVVPWYIGSEGRIRAAKTSDLEEGKTSLAELIDLLHLRVIVLLGRKAQRLRADIERLASGVAIHESPHPSPMFVNRKPENRHALLEAFRSARASLDRA